jgi:hypothetical protein
MTKLVDFDAYLREQEAEPFILRVGGREYNLPPSPAASVAMRFARLQRETETMTPIEAAAAFEQMGRDLFGPDVFRQLVDDGILLPDGSRRGFTMSELEALIKQVADAYNEEATPPPNRKTRRATSQRKRSTS